MRTKTHHVYLMRLNFLTFGYYAIENILQCSTLFFYSAIGLTKQPKLSRYYIRTLTTNLMVLT